MKPKNYLPIFLTVMFVVIYSSTAMSDSENSWQSLNQRYLGPLLRLVYGGDIPSRSEIESLVLPASQYPNGQAIIDGSLLSVFSTPTGRRWCGEVLRGDANLIAYHTGASLDAAQVIASGCQGEVAETERSILQNSRKEFAPRYYSFMIVGKRKTAIESWTSSMNETVFVVEDKSLDEAKLIRLIIHELAVYFDSKSRLTPKRAATLPGFDAKLPEPACAAQSALGNPMISFALSAMRAFEVERALESELSAQGAHIAPEEGLSPILDKGRCTERIEKVIDLMMPLSTHIWAHGNYTQYCSLDGQSGLYFEIGMMTRHSPEKVKYWVDKDLKAFRKAMASSGDTEEKFCEYYLRPEISGRNIHFSSGPRPRIKGW